MCYLKMGGLLDSGEKSFQNKSSLRLELLHKGEKVTEQTGQQPSASK